MDKKIKKLIMVVAMSTITVGLFAGCSKSNEESSNSTGEQTNQEEVVTEEDKTTLVDGIEYLTLEEDENAADALKVQEMCVNWNYVNDDESKVAYLTFDDGPSATVTDQVLDVLKEKDIKATFFVLGSNIDKNNKSKETFKRIVKEGHAVGNHGYSHQYQLLYPNDTVDVTAFMDDMNKSLNSMKAVLGDNFNTRVLRFPGGHSAWYTDAIDKELESKNLAFVDWNALNGDSEGKDLTANEALENLKKSVTDMNGNNDNLIVLMHDTDANLYNPEYLGKAIDYLKSEGYIFKSLK